MKKTKKNFIMRYVLVIVSVLIGIPILLIIGLTIIIGITKSSPEIVLLPKSLPSGFVMEKVYVESPDGTYAFEFINSSQKKFSLTVESNHNLLCTPPPSGSSIERNFIPFNPTGSSIGCASTFTQNSLSSRLYIWKMKSYVLHITVRDGSISDNDALVIASSVTHKLIWLGQYITLKDGTKSYEIK